MAWILLTSYQTIMTELSQHTRNILKQMLPPPHFIYLQSSFHEMIPPFFDLSFPKNAIFLLVNFHSKVLKTLIR